MSVGAMAFLFKVMVNTNPFLTTFPEWFLALEYAGGFVFTTF